MYLFIFLAVTLSVAAFPRPESLGQAERNKRRAPNDAPSIYRGMFGGPNFGNGGYPQNGFGGPWSNGGRKSFGPFGGQGSNMGGPFGRNGGRNPLGRQDTNTEDDDYDYDPMQYDDGDDDVECPDPKDVIDVTVPPELGGSRGGERGHSRNSWRNGRRG
ncbi:hypothetical protein COOONC_24225 [Cooperia oncophora]